ncbi:unnamed protein product [Brassica napus]|uniref:non-specific serine/threonine protein kinase n=1 Tax=Brassica napus TaxID=3708 RepID=A0A817AHB0_BRANA|nr:unnamed protein product [Brassica napus]
MWHLLTSSVNLSTLPLEMYFNHCLLNSNTYFYLQEICSTDMVIDHRHIRRLLRFWPMNKVLTQKDEFTEQDANDSTDFLVTILDFVSEKRPTLSECLLHPWISCGPRSIEPSLITTRDKNLKQS